MVILTDEVRQAHWNYLGVLEEDMLRASRYVEFATGNFSTFSIEFAHLLFASCAEIEVVLKRLCELFVPGSKAERMLEYRETLAPHLIRFGACRVLVPRFQLTLHPWDNWEKARTSPDWWKSYNNVKHGRHEHFREATLHAALNALAALFLVALQHSCVIREGDGLRSLNTMDVQARAMLPPSQLFAFGGYAKDGEMTTAHRAQA